MEKKLEPEKEFLAAIFGHPKESAQPTSEEQTDHLQAKVEQVIKTLSFREREIIKLRFGLGDGYAYTQEEVSEIFKVTRGRIKQIEAKALHRLRQPPYSQEMR